jgi:hypothetical protein
MEAKAVEFVKQGAEIYKKARTRAAAIKLFYIACLTPSRA